VKFHKVILAILVCGLLAGCPQPPQPQPPPSTQLFGWSPSPEGVQDFIDSLPHPEFQDAAPNLVASNQPVFLYRALPKEYRNEPQQIGDCVSWGHKHAVDILGAIDFKLGLSNKFLEVSSESIYGGARVESKSRPEGQTEGIGEGSGGYRDGSYGAAACKWLLNYGVVYRDVYQTPNGEIDLRTYSGNRAKDWGNFGNGGRNDKGFLDKVAKNHPVKAVARVRTWEDFVKAMQNGYPVTICSSVGFDSPTDSNGFCRRNGVWNHCMTLVGVRFDIEGGLILNSHGPNSPNQSRGIYPEDQPKGSFWATRKTVEDILAAGDSWAISGVKGFPPKKMHEGW
jgi:hypothetical protein